MTYNKQEIIGIKFTNDDNFVISDSELFEKQIEALESWQRREALRIIVINTKSLLHGFVDDLRDNINDWYESSQSPQEN